MTPQTLKFTIPKDQLEAATAEFYHFYGHALARWSQLETSLYYWFAKITGMPDAMARGIFYSARSFAARAEMLEAALEHATHLKDSDIAFLKEALKKARNYSGFRNKLAHGEPRLAVTKDGETVKGVHYTISQGRNQPSATEELLTVQDLFIAAEHFHVVAECAREALGFPPNRPNPKSPEECLSLVRALPNEPHDKNAPTASASAPRPEGTTSHRNKKEYRAEQRARKDAPP